MGVYHVKWKPLFAVLLGLLMVGVTAGSAMAKPISSPITEPIQPQYFGDKNQLHLEFDPYSSYEVEIPYDAYMEKQYPPANSPCFKNICPTAINGEVR